MDHYQVLNVSRDATIEQIKSSYRQLILVHHPDKQVNQDSANNDQIQAINEAYRVLSDPSSRQEYDLLLLDDTLFPLTANTNPNLHSALQHSRTTTTRPQKHPNRVVSLDLFTFHGPESENVDDFGFFTLPCRCSATYHISEEDLEQGVDLIACEGCGEVIGVGYELVDGEDDEEEEMVEKEVFK